MRLKPDSVRTRGHYTPQRTILRTDHENTYWLDFSMQLEISESPSQSPSPPSSPHPAHRV